MLWNNLVHKTINQASASLFLTVPSNSVFGFLTFLEARFKKKKKETQDIFNA